MNKFNKNEGLSERIKEAMRDRDISQGMLANRVGLSQPAVWRLVNGSSKSSRKIIPIAAVLGVSPEWLESGNGPKSGVDDAIGDESLYRISAIDPEMIAGCDETINAKARAVRSVNLSEEYARNLFGNRPPEDIRLLTMPNDAMGKTIADGSLLFVDIKVNKVTSDGVYVFINDGVLDVRRLQRQGVRFCVISDNELYEKYHIEERDVFNVGILGRVILASGESLKKL